jgi:lipid-A-disaccharide synthase
MLKAVEPYADRYSIVIAKAPNIEEKLYSSVIASAGLSEEAVTLTSDTYALLSRSTAALVVSGTAVLETALFRVPQVVCYRTSHPRFFGWLRKQLLKVKYVSLVNLITDREVVPELVADTFSIESINHEFTPLLPDESPQRLQMLQGYEEVNQRLGNTNAPEEAARIMTSLLQ